MVKFFVGLCLAICLTTVLLLSCKKDQQFTAKQTTLVDKAEQWYLASTKEFNRSPNATKPNWENARFLKSAKGEQLIVVPADKENKTNNPKYGILTSFVFVCDDRKVNSGNIIQILGEKDIIQQQGQSLIASYQTLSFKGVKDGALIIFDINHNYIDGRNIKNERVSRDLGAQMSTAGSDPLANSVLVNGVKVPVGKVQTASLYAVPTLSVAKNSISRLSLQGEQTCIDWYWTTWDVNTGQILSQTYVYTTCEPSGSGGISIASVNTPPPCASSFHFVTKITGSTSDPRYEGGWQVAAIRNIRLNLVSSVLPPVSIQMPLLYFGLPVVKIDGQNYTYEIAQNIATRAVKAAEDAAFEVYLLNPPGVQAVATAKFKSTLVAEMAKYAGTVTETSPGIGITVLDKDITIAQYPIIWNFGC